MTISETISYLQSFSKSGTPVKDLSRIRTLLNELDNPQEQLHFVHIAGTNGKGSVVTYCAAATAAAGYRTGKFTSPFLLRYQDRIQINGVDIADDRLCELCERVAACSVSADCSQFEVTFAIALLYFLEQSCDIVFLETGIGGLLDATNLISAPLVSVITSISFDHTAILGDTLEKIAAQKLGIVKRGCPLVLSSGQSPEVERLAEITAEQFHAPLTIPEISACTLLSETLNETRFLYHGVTYTLRMPGRHQIENAITAIETIGLLGMHGFLIPSNVLAEALEKVTVPARIQKLQDMPPVLLDGGHNPAGVAAFAEILQQFGKRPIIGIVGMVQGKEYTTACETFNKVLDSVICVEDFAPNAIPAKTLAACFSEKAAVEILPYVEAYQTAVAQADALDGMVAIGGSLYLASAILELLEQKKEIRL